MSLNIDSLEEVHLNLLNAVEPIMNGTITGPGLNATITGGVAYPSFIYDQTFQIPEINAWGTTDDGEPFFVKESGIGLLSKQISRIVCVVSSISD
jgi:hypothetical protein